jgi:hypothetical protein
MKDQFAVLAFNRGMVSQKALSRIDVDRMAFSADTQTNFIPSVMGSMSLRPGLEYISNTRNNNKARHIPFVFSVSDTALIELTNAVMRVYVNDELITRPSVSTTVTNGNFTTDLSGWTDLDESGADSIWEIGGYMALTGTGANSAIRSQQVTVSGANLNVEHALRIFITRSGVKLRVGSTSGDDDYIRETLLLPGTHSLAFTPSGNFWIQFSNNTKHSARVFSVNVESTGNMEIATQWDEDDGELIKYTQSGDVLFVACNGKKQQRIERRAVRSWSVVDYVANDGPFLTANTGPIRLSTSAISGDITVTASAPLFRSTHNGALFKITSIGQQVTQSLNGEDEFSDPIRVSGIDNGRLFAINISGTWSATITIQRSIEEPGSWTDVTSYTTNQSTSYTDGLDNQIIYYRIGIKTGNYTSGSATASLIYSAGSISGVVRLFAVASSVSASASVLKDLGGTSSTDDWAEGQWSTYRGFPSAVSFMDGRLFWAGKDKINGSISDNYSSFDPDFEGDAGPISRSIGSGPVDTINWLLPLKQILIGGQGAELVIRSSSFDEPLTPTNFNIKEISTHGSSNVSPAKVDTSGIFVANGGSKILELAYGERQSLDYSSVDMASIVPEICQPSIVAIGVQRKPDTRIHCVRSDGKVAMLVFDKVENVKAWILIETDGEVEDVVVLPGSTEDEVYYSVKRTINSSTVRFLEKWALESECDGEAVNKQADSFVSGTNSPASDTITGLDHLEGEEVICWADGLDMGAFTVSGGEITLPSEVSQYVVGLPYRARFKSVKLSHITKQGISFFQRKIVPKIGLLLHRTHCQGLRYGKDFDNLDDLPLVDEHELIDENSIIESFDTDFIPFNMPRG